MRQVESLLNAVGYEIDQLTRNIERKVSQTRGQWTGEARQGFEDTHRRLLSQADRIQRELDEMKRAARRLESSVQAADWDMAEKARLARQAQMARQYGGQIR